MEEFLKSWASSIVSLLAVGTIVFGWFTNPAKKVATRVEEMDKRLVDVEAKLPHLPSRDDVYKLSLEMTELRGEMKVQATKLSAMFELLERLQDKLDRVEDKIDRELNRVDEKIDRGT